MRTGLKPVIAVLLWLLSPALLATTESERLLKQDIDRQEQERRERRREELRGTETPSVEQPAKPEASVPDTGPCFPVSTITLVPDNILPASRTKRLLDDARGKCLSAADLSALQQGLNAIAMDQGLVTTRVVVPEQNLASGALRLEVWPGRLELARSVDLRPRELENALPLREGDLLNLRALEQAVDSLNRMASVQAAVELLPGQNPGGSVAEFRANRGRPWQAGLSWNGQSLESHPVNSVRANATLDSPLHLADRLIVGVSANVQDESIRHSGSQSIDYDIPFGWNRLSAGLDRSFYDNPVSTGLTTFTASGLTRTFRFEAGRLIRRDARNRWSLALHGQRRLANNDIDGVHILVSTSRQAAGGVRLDYSRVSAPWVVDASFDVDGGQVSMLANPSPVDSHFERIKANARCQYHFMKSSLKLELDGQWSDDTLLPSEQFSLVNSVGGFSPLSISSPIEASARLEWARPVSLPRASFSLRPAAGLEYAYAPRNAESQTEWRLMSAGTTVTLGWRQVLGRIEAAIPVVQESNIESPSNWQLNASLSIQW